MVVAVELDGDQHVENDVADRCDRGEQIVRAAGAAEDSLLWVPGAPQLCHPLRRRLSPNDGRLSIETPRHLEQRPK